MAILVILLDLQALDTNRPRMVVDHLPRAFSYRTGDITANLSGRLLSPVFEIRYRLNYAPWHGTVQKGPRVHKPLFCIEMDPRELRRGKNTILITAVSRFGGRTKVTRDFYYDPSPVRLPLDVTWNNLQDLDVESGIWEIVTGGDQMRIRPKPGFEDYDRIAIAAGAFAGGRRVTTDVIFRSASAKNDTQEYGFGVLPLWGGRPDNHDYSPRRGWNFSIAWYYSHYNGVGEEFSFKKGSEEPRWISSYRDFDLQPGVRFTIVAEAREVLDGNGNHKKYQQRMRWGKESDTEVPWIELSDDGGALIPPGEYAVGLVAHRCQVEFGPVRIESLPPEVQAAAGDAFQSRARSAGAERVTEPRTQRSASPSEARSGVSGPSNEP